MSEETSKVVSIAGRIVVTFVVVLVILAAISFCIGLLLPAIASYSDRPPVPQ